MPSSPVLKIVKNLCKTAIRRDVDTLSDGQLLDRFLETRDEDAFARLVRRHGPMVWGVCQRIVGRAVDAEDAFQAAFLILVRKAAAIKPRNAVGNWLYGVACHTAMKARTAANKVRGKEKQVTRMPELARDPRDDREDLQRVLDQELSALPDKYRLPVVLCDLEGRTRREVAVCESVGLSARRFIDVFADYVGLTPKLYCRVRRFQDALTRISGHSEVDWALIALTCGYFDQAHFIRDFRAFAGVTPTTYLIERGEHQNHLRFSV